MSEKMSGMGGFIVVETESGQELARVHNQVTALLEEVVAGLSLGGAFTGNSALEAGQNFVFGPVAMQDGTRDYYSNSDSLITVYLLNLSETERSALTKSSTLLPVYDSEFKVDSSKIVGYATAKFSATEPKEGFLIPMTGVNLINPRRNGLSFKWDTGVLSGVYNCIAVGFNVMKYPYAGVSIYRGLESNNPILGETLPGGYMVKSGIHNSDGSVVITGENEILLGDSSAIDKGRKILNLATGETTLLSSGDVRYDFPLVDGYYAQLCSGNYFIYSTGSALYKIDLTTKSRTTVSNTGYDCFIYNGFIYSRYSTSIYRAYNPETLAYVSSKNLTIANMNIPSEYLETNSGYTFGISNVGDDFLLSYKYAYNVSYSTSYPLMKALICSDPTNIMGSIIEILPYLNSFNGCVVSGKRIFFNSLFPHTDTTTNQSRYKNSAGTSYTNIRKNGLKMTMDDLCGNLLSFKTFDSDQQIPSGEGLKLTYYYTFEQ